MTTLLKNGKVVNVFTDKIEEKNVLIEDRKIIGVGDYDEADIVIDVSGKYICPSFIDGHIHIESTMLLPHELSNVCVPHGTGTIIADPHEIANVCGVNGIKYMMEASRDLPMEVYIALPSCVPATGFDESGAVLLADDLAPLYSEESTICLGEMMNYPGVLAKDPQVMEKIRQAQENGMLINGHAPLLSGKGLDQYISCQISDDHECSNIDEATERIQKGQWIMIREGTSARNLENLIELFNEPYCRRCLLVTDDKHPYDLISNGHIDAIIRKTAALGKDPIVGIRMATIQAAEHFGLKYRGAVAPGYKANLLVLNDLETVDVCDVFHNGIQVCRNKDIAEADAREVDIALSSPVFKSFNIEPLIASDFTIEPQSDTCRVIKVIPGEILTGNTTEKLDFSHDNGVDVERDIIKIAVCERHKNTGHIGLGFIKDLGLKKGAIASSVSHDSHNLIIAGTNEADMALAGNTVAEMGGGLCAVADGKVIAALPLPVAGLMSTKDAATVAEENRKVRDAAAQLGCAEDVEPFMSLAFISLPVIPDLKMTTIGLVDVSKWEIVPLFV